MRFGLTISLRELFWLTLVAVLLLDRWRLSQRLEDFRDESEYLQSLVTVRDHQFKTYWHMIYNHATRQQGWDSQEAYDKLVELSHPIRQEDWVPKTFEFDEFPTSLREIKATSDSQLGTP